MAGFKKQTLSTDVFEAMPFSLRAIDIKIFNNI
jgi:hypothetical protein